jgi:hypothetical protein
VDVIGPLIALAGVVVGGVLSYVFAFLGETRRERWALAREWRERRLQAYSSYVAEVKHMRDIAQRIAADVGLDETAPPLSRDAGADLLTEANMSRSRAFETVSLLADKELIEAARALNRAIWRLEWFARGRLDDSDADGWHNAVHGYHQAIDVFHRHARRELGIAGEYSPREAEGSPREQYEQERRSRFQ